MAETDTTNTEEKPETEKKEPAAPDPKEELEASRAELKEQRNKYLYLYAEFENFKKRAIKERSEQLKFGHEGLARELLSVADNLDRALQHTEQGESLIAGIRLVSQQLKDALAKYGVTPIDSLGSKFDPLLHEAIGRETLAAEANGEKDGSVIQEHQKGYLLHGRLLRPARVVVATKES